MNLMIADAWRRLAAEGRARLRALVSSRESAARGLGRLESWNERRWELMRFALIRPPGSAEMTALLGRMGVKGFFPYVLGQQRGHYGLRTFIPAGAARVAAALRRDHPGEVRVALEQAELCSKGIFDLLGSGPVDMRRGRHSPGWAIDWSRDPISGERFGRACTHWRWNPARMRPGRADLKGPWELTRCQHFAAMGQAYWLTGDPRFARCFAGTIADFLRRNPPGHGIHWACTMDAALRVVGWIAGLSFFQGAPELTRRWWAGFLRGLVAHGRFIAANLEMGTWNGRIITSNHLVSNLLGLYWLSMAFPHLDVPCTWRGIAENGLEQEILKQIQADGSNFESSVPYQRLDVEMFLSAYAMSRHHNLPLSDAYRCRLIKALEFITAIRQEGGRVPQIGDADNGRAHILTGYGRWDQETMDPLLAAAERVLDHPFLPKPLSPAAAAEQVFWGPAGAPMTSAPPPARLAVFPESGIAVLRGGPAYLLLSNGPVGTRGFGNHKHNDQLAVEWALGGQPLIVDGGSYCYTGDPAMRNRFRSVSTHNTVMADDQEQNLFDPGHLFRMEQQGEATLLETRRRNGSVGIAARHTAYARLNPPLIHTRRVMVEQDGRIVLEDLFDGSEGHTLRWHFLLYPGVSAEIAPGLVLLRAPGASGRIDTPGSLTFRLEPGWYSPSYGKLTSTSALVAERSGGPAKTVLVLHPGAGDPDGPRAAAESAAAFWQ